MDDDDTEALLLDLLRRARTVAAGDAPEDDRFLAVLFELPPGADPDDASLWWMANPSLGVTVTQRYLGREFRIAQGAPSGKKLADFRSQHLNIEQDETLAIDRWVPLKDWRAIEVTLSLDELLEQSEST